MFKTERYINMGSLVFFGGVITMYPSMGGKEDSAGGLFDGLPAAEEHGSAAPKSQAVPQARKHVMIQPCTPQN